MAYPPAGTSASPVGTETAQPRAHIAATKEAPGAMTSSPGLAFLLTTIAAYGEVGWQGYWSKLMANGTELTQGWSDAYEVDFTQGGGNGDRPIVLSYDSSPAFTIDGKGGTTTSALLDTCFRLFHGLTPAETRPSSWPRVCARPGSTTARGHPIGSVDTAALRPV